MKVKRCKFGDHKCGLDFINLHNQLWDYELLFVLSLYMQLWSLSDQIQWLGSSCMLFLEVFLSAQKKSWIWARLSLFWILLSSLCSTSFLTFSLQLLFHTAEVKFRFFCQLVVMTETLNYTQTGEKMLWSSFRLISASFLSGSWHITCSWCWCYSYWSWYLKISPPFPQWHSPLHSWV